MSKPLPRRPAHELELPLVSGGRFALFDRRPEQFLMIVFYRGLHCPVCGDYLKKLEQRLEQFEQQGVQVVAASCDDEARARQSVDEWQLRRLEIAYGLRIDEAESWDLYVSDAISNEESNRFCEPGLFLIKPDHTVYAAWVQSMPYARPDLGEVLSGIELAIREDYPARGEVEGGVGSS